MFIFNFNSLILGKLKIINNVWRLHLIHYDVILRSTNLIQQQIIKHLVRIKSYRKNI